MRKPVYAGLLTLLTIGGAVVLGYVVAFAIGGQTPRSAAIAALAMDLPTLAVPSYPADAVVVPAPSFDTLGVEPEPASPAPAASAQPEVAAAEPSGSPQPPAPAVTATPAASPSTRPFPSVESSGATASASGPRALPPTTTATFVSETFDSEFSGWPVRPLEGWGGAYENGQYVVRVEGAQPVGIAYPVKGGDFRLAMDVSVDSGAAGLAFLFQQPASFLWVGVDDAGQAGVERIDGETITAVVPWRPIGAPAGKTVRIEVSRRGNAIAVSAAGRPLAQIDVPEGTWEGRYGFVVAPRDNLGAAAFDNLVGERLP